MGGPKSVDHLGRDPPPTADLITASACPITDVGALLACPGVGLSTSTSSGSVFQSISRNAFMAPRFALVSIHFVTISSCYMPEGSSNSPNLIVTEFDCSR